MANNDNVYEIKVKLESNIEGIKRTLASLKNTVSTLQKATNAEGNVPSTPFIESRISGFKELKEVYKTSQSYVDLEKVLLKRIEETDSLLKKKMKELEETEDIIRARNEILEKRSELERKGEIERKKQRKSQGGESQKTISDSAISTEKPKRTEEQEKYVERVKGQIQKKERSIYKEIESILSSEREKQLSILGTSIEEKVNKDFRIQKLKNQGVAPKGKKGNYTDSQIKRVSLSEYEEAKVKFEIASLKSERTKIIDEILSEIEQGIFTGETLDDKHRGIIGQDRLDRLKGLKNASNRISNYYGDETRFPKLQELSTKREEKVIEINEKKEKEKELKRKKEEDEIYYQEVQQKKEQLQKKRSTIISKNKLEIKNPQQLTQNEQSLYNSFVDWVGQLNSKLKKGKDFFQLFDKFYETLSDSSLKSFSDNIRKARKDLEEFNAQNQSNLSSLQVTSVPVALDEDTHTYVELTQKGTPKKRGARNFSSVTQIAGAITQQSDLSDFMKRGQDALKEGIPLQQVYSAEELKRFYNTREAAKRGTTIHKAIELLEKGVVSDLNAAKEYISNLATKAVESGEENPFISLESSKNFEEVKTVVEKYMDMKKQLGLGDLVTAEIPLGANVTLPSGKSINIGGTLDALLSGGTLMDYKATASLDKEKITIQENLLNLLLQANREKLSKEYGLNPDSLVGNMLVAHMPPKKIDSSYIGEIEQVSQDVMVEWLEAFLNGAKIAIEQKVTPLAMFKEYDFNGNEGEAISFGGKFLGNWANDFLRWGKIAEAENDPNMQVMSEDERNSLYDRLNVSYKERKKYSNVFVTPEEIEEAKKNISQFFTDIANVFGKATDEQKILIAKKIYGSDFLGKETDEEIELKRREFEGDKYPFYSELREYLDQYAPDIREVWEDYLASQPWSDDDNLIKASIQSHKKTDEKTEESRERAKELGITITHNMKKETIIKKIEEKESESGEDQNPKGEQVIVCQFQKS